MAAKGPGAKSHKELRWLRLISWGTWLVVLLAPPLVSVWLASSLSAYLNGPRWAAFASGALIFPVLPIAWEIHARSARSRLRPAAPRWLTWRGRLALRTAAIGLAFLTAILALRPQQAFLALATRGDWMLDGRSGKAAQLSRSLLFDAAGGLAWLYQATREKPFARYRSPTEPAPFRPPPSPAAPTPDPQGASPPAPSPPALENASHSKDAAARAVAHAQAQDSGESASDDEVEVVGYYVVDGRTHFVTQRRAGVPRAEPNDGPAAAPARSRESSGNEPAWPLPPVVDPAVARIPDTAEVSIEALAAHLAQVGRDPFHRVKLVHDYVADRVVYDVEAYTTKQYRAQDAQAVFKSRLAVCAGFAKLFEVIAKAMGLEVATVVGVAKASGATPEPHAWNAVRIDGTWRLLDVTWDSGAIVSGAYQKRYDTSYLLAPAEAFVASHLPDEEGWQLLPKPLTTAEFLRQPRLSPGFFARHLELVGDARAQIDARGSVELALKNPASVDLVAWVLSGAKTPRECTAANAGGQTHFRCDLPEAGTFQIAITEPSTEEPTARGPRKTYKGLAAIEVANRD